MSRDELASALQFQAADLIPIPLDDAVLDFAILGHASPGDGGEPRMHVLLAAAHEATVRRLVAAVEAGGLQVAAVDLVPLALIRRSLASRLALGRRRAGERRRAGRGVGAEGIVSFGGGVTAIAVHEGGVPRFVRVLGTGGRELTDAIAAELDLPPETAEALKRQLARRRATTSSSTRARAVDRAAAVGAARRSPQLARLLPQPAGLVAADAHRRDRWRARSSPGLTERLSALVGVPVEHARPARARRARRHRLPRRGAPAPRPVPARPPSASRSAAPASAPSSTCCRGTPAVDDVRRASAADRAEGRSRSRRRSSSCSAG